MMFLAGLRVSEQMGLAPSFFSSESLMDLRESFISLGSSVLEKANRMVMNRDLD